MLSQSRTTSSRRSDLVVLGTAKLRHRKSISWPTTRGRDVSKRILMEFTIVSNEIQFFVIRNSKLAGPRTRVKSTPHTSHFLFNSHLMTRTCVAQVVSLACAHHIPCAIFMRSCCVFDSLRLLHFPSPCCPSSLLSSLSFLLPIIFIFHDVVDKFPVHFS